jgi:hypothetical protein
MRLEPVDFLYYSYCPYLYGLQNKRLFLNPAQTLLEENLREAIIETEKRCLLKEASISPRKIFRALDNTWWPAATEAGLPAKEIEQKVLVASKLASDYCRYEFVEYETIATNIDLDINISNSVLTNNYNVIKRNNDNIVILDLVRKNLTQNNIVGDIGVLASCLIIGKNANQTVNYINILLDETKQTISTSIFILNKEDILAAEKTIKFFEYGLRNGVRFPNKWNCEECKSCKNFQL